MIDSLFEIRGCESRRELEEVVELCDIAFPKTKKEYFERHILRDRTLSPADTRILLKDGTIVSSVQVFPRSMYLMGRKVSVGGIGNVATHPSQRGNGYAGMVMQDSLNYIRQKGFMISVLTTTINKYYEKFGFITIKRRLGSMEVPHAREHPQMVPFLKDRDLEKLARLYIQYNRDSNGPFVRDSTYWLSQLDFCGEDKNLFFLYKEEDEIVGFIRAKKNNDAVQVLEYGVADHREKIICKLIEHLAFAANQPRLELLISDKEKVRMSLGEFNTSRLNSEMMVNIINASLDQEVKDALLRDYELTFWLTDFF
jgi:predicted N-acetyltransferase YhbS